MFEEHTYPAVLQRMLARVPDTLDKREGSVICDALAPAAMELARVYIELARVVAESFGDTASRETLILRCRERGLAPYEASCAVLKAAVTPASLDVTGRRFVLGEEHYTARAALGEGLYELQCETPGAAGGRQFGRLEPVGYIPGLERAEAVSLLIPGEDEEDTEALRARYLASFAEDAFGGNRRDYLTRTNAIAGVGSCKVTRAWNGDIRPAQLLPDAEVSAWVAGALPALAEKPAAWLSAVHEAAASGKLTVGGAVRVTVLDAQFSPASPTLVAAVRAALDPPDEAGEGAGGAPIGHVVTVESAAPVAVDVATALTFEAGASWETVQSAAEQAVADYLLELRRAWAAGERLTVRISQLEMRLLALAGVADVAHTALCGAEQNLTLDPLEVPVPGGVTCL